MQFDGVVSAGGGGPIRKLSVKRALRDPIPVGATRGIALFDYKAQQVRIFTLSSSEETSLIIWFQAGDLSFQKGDVIHIIEKSDSTDDWCDDTPHPYLISLTYLPPIGGQAASIHVKVSSPPTL